MLQQTATESAVLEVEEHAHPEIGRVFVGQRVPLF